MTANDSGADLVRRHRDGSLEIVTLANPDGNRFSEAMLTSLQSALAQVAGSHATALLILAEGPDFSHGGDVRGVLTKPIGELSSIVAAYLDLIRMIERLPIPTISAVQGVCSSGGLEFALACDLIWAAEDAQLGFLEPLVGILPLAGGVQRLAARAGPTRAFEMATSGRLFDAGDLERWNVVNRVVPAGRLQRDAIEHARALASGPTLAYAGTKALLRAWDRGGVDEADAIMVETMAPVMDSSRARTTIAEYLKRIDAS